MTVGAELRALSTASDAKRYLLWDRIKKGCRSLCENAPRHLDAFATQAGRQVAALGGRDGLVTLLVAHAPKVPAVAEACLQASLTEPPKLTGGTPVEFARGADEVLTRGSVNAVSGRTCDIECEDKTTAKHVLIDKVRRFTVMHEPETTGALKRAEIALRVLKPALEGVDVGAFSTLVEGKACVPERLIAGTPSLVTKMRSAAVTDALRLLRLVDGKCETASTTFEAAATALAAGVEADVRPSTLKVLLDLVRAAKVDADKSGTIDYREFCDLMERLARDERHNIKRTIDQWLEANPDADAASSSAPKAARRPAGMSSRETGMHPTPQDNHGQHGCQAPARC